MLEPSLPKRITVEEPLLNVLLDMGGRVNFSEDGRQIEMILAKQLGLTDEKRDFSASNYNSKGNRKWRNEIQFVRDRLVKKGEIDNSIRNYWIVTSKGAQRVGKALSENITSKSKDQSSNIVDVIFEDDELFFPEGKRIYQLHRDIERNASVVKSAKEKAFQKDTLLHCQVCGFSFKETYGTLGKGFIEAHHILPLSELKTETVTKTEDILMVCSNCHRMLHRKRPWISLRELDSLLYIKR